MEEKTEKIKVTVTTEEVRELDISFPYYTKRQGLWCKFISKDEAIWVCDYRSNKEIQWSVGTVPESWITFEQITESEFNAKFKEVMNYLIEKNNENAI